MYMSCCVSCLRVGIRTRDGTRDRASKAKPQLHLQPWSLHERKYHWGPPLVLWQLHPAWHRMCFPL